MDLLGVGLIVEPIRLIGEIPGTLCQSVLNKTSGVP
jgi:hypothetical protein